MDATRAFVFAYSQNLDRYEACARHVRQELRALLRGEGLRAIVTSRAKGPSRLEEKLRRRETERGKHYATVADVAADVHDLVGARVALYYPGTQARVSRLIEERFEAVSEMRVFPSDSGRPVARLTHEGGLFLPRFSGYAATHHRIRFRPDQVPADLLDLVAPSGLTVEVQVASVLMHAWAEVEHDLVYKPSSGELSLDEYAVLDELNGLVLAGELALERLERAESSRLFTLARPFDDAYELAGFLSSRLRAEGSEPGGLGRTDVLFALLRRFGKNTPSAILELVSQVREPSSSIASSDPEARVADRLARAFAEGHDDREAVLREVSRGGAFGDLAEDGSTHALSAFLERYRAVDRCVGALLGAIGEWGKRLVVSARGAALLVERGMLTEEEARALDALRSVRDRVLRQDPDLDAAGVVDATRAIDDFLGRLASSANAEVATIARREIEAAPASESASLQ